MTHFAELRHELETYLDSEAVEQIHQAYRFAAHAHKGQQRQTGDPYITHPLAVAQILAQMRMDKQTILAAILHDVIEDTPTEKEVIAEQFGVDVAELVDGVSKLTQINFQNRAEAQAENFRKMLLAMAKDIRVILVKLADRLHNMRTLGALVPEKKRRIAQETMEIYVPIAKRLGMHAFRVEFEDLSFAAVHPLRFRILQEAARQARRARKKMISQIETLIKEGLEKNKLPPSAVWARQKHLSGVYRDMKEKHLSFAEIMDVYTFCVAVDSVDTCYRALGVVHSLYKPLPERFRDYIALPKANGYQSLHTTVFGPHGVPIEIQIRTVDMDNMADSGIAAHWLDTTEATASPAHMRAREWMRRLLDIQQTTGNALEFIENVKIDLFPEEVYVFTPKGDILELPRGATPIDFAYAIHSDIGNSVVAARLDRRLVPLSTLLANGQTIEVVTSPEAKPNPAWLNFVVTGRARSKIRHYLKSQHRNESVIFGQRLLEAALTLLGKSWAEIPAENLSAVLQHFQFKNTDDLLEAVGVGNQMAPLVAQFLISMTNAPALDSASHHLVQSLVIKGTEGLLVNFAECCRPIPGDCVVGILSVGHGVNVHQAHCKHVLKFSKSPEKFISVYWDENIQGNFKSDLRVAVANQPGGLAQLASAIAKANANIDNISVEQGDASFCLVHLIVSVHNRVHLAQVLKRLRAVKAVARLARGK